MKGVTLSSALAVGLISILATFIYSRADILSCFYYNAPSRLQKVNNLKNFEVKFTDTVRNCEDALINEDQGYALLSCDPGRDTWNTVMGTFRDSKAASDTGIYILNYAENTSKPEKLKLLDFAHLAEAFHPLGIDYDAGTNTLYVVNHDPAGSKIEMFKLFPSELSATHIGTVAHRLLRAPNAVTALNDKELLVTNDHLYLRKQDPWMSMAETYLGTPGGNIMHVDLNTIYTDLKPTVKVLARVPFANGIVLLNETALAVASSNTNAIRIYSIGPSSDANVRAPKLTLTHTVLLPFHPDNLSTDKDGKLLIAGHPHTPTLEKIAKNNARCNADGSENKEGCELRGLSWISEWSEKEGLRNLYVGDDYGTSSTALRDVTRDVGIGVGLYEKGIMSWKE